MIKVLLLLQDCKLEYLPLKDIKGVDPYFQDLLVEMDLNFPLGIHIKDWDDQIFMAFLNCHPLCVRKLAHGYQCIGGFRQFKIAQSLQSRPGHGSMVAPVIVFPSRLTPEKKVSLLCAELFMAPAIFRIKHRDARQLQKSFLTLQSKYPDLKNMDFGKAMGLDARSYDSSKTRKKDT